MKEKNISQQVYEYSKEHGGLFLPDGVAAKTFTVKSNDKPYITALIFEDGSELTLGKDGKYFWSDDCEYRTEIITTPKLKNL